jgi:hypothetical protein
MQKPTGYDEAKASGDFTPVELGGHYAVIKQVSETTSGSGVQMVVVVLDFAGNDKQPEYHSRAFKSDDRDDKKWPYNGTKWVFVYDAQDRSKTSRQFKTFCTCFEKSNGVQIQWGGSNWGQQFKGKKIGVVYGEEENEYDGKITMRRVPRWFCDWNKVNDQKIPEPKYLSGHDASTVKAASANTGTTADSYVNDTTGADEEEIPF